MDMVTGIVMRIYKVIMEDLMESRMIRVKAMIKVSIE